MRAFSRRLRQLEAAFAEQRREIERLRGTIASSSDLVAGYGTQLGAGLAVDAGAGRSADVPRSVVVPRTDEPVAPSGEPDVPAAKRSTRRALVTGGAVAAGATLVGSFASPNTAAAADGGNMVIGADNLSAAGNTRLTVGAGALLPSDNLFTVTSGLTSSLFPAAVGGAANGGRVTNGVYGYTDHRSTDDRTGHAIIARRESQARSNLLMPPAGPPPTVDATVNHRPGSFRVDNTNNLWFCVTGGTPGSWRRLSGPGSSGAVHLVAPARVYDSRLEAAGPLAPDASRIVSVADRRNVTTYEIDLPNLVPLGALAVFFNVTVTQTVGVGFLAVAPGDQTTVTASTINWSASGQNLANASTSTLDTVRQLNVLSGGPGSTHFVIDITGYTL